ncbi:homogentisate phytyltransferase [Aphanothece sacrum]|uniref:UbiA prenyltransferase n=1 Tax=Aphanothece sacrum FPU1 TaxID=1920663 RepID=A0A401IIF4_APHSA|nr:homogentisate phytyltransferase [Aphanothece sacrum]GBF81068.1 UbiA prenyltransferase [Aphanothece sacrum FPU1]GBF85469.1 UbiA prenyltransferase [Aphanothece sacrum FPU3]
MPQISLVKPKNFTASIFSGLWSFWKFSRPHTIFGTSLSVLCLYFIALPATNNVINLSNFVYLLGALMACLCGNIYIVGLNQLEDREIDQINKPHLPIAAGEFSVKQGILIVAITGILSLVLGFIFGWWLLATIGISLVIGTAYSLPPIRLKRFPFFAALCIFTVRGLIVNLGLFLYFTSRLSNTAFLLPSIWILTGFIVVFTVAIAIFKDVPDLEGDKQYNIITFTLLLGKSSIFKITCGIIIFCYLTMIVIGIFQISGINSWILISSHLSLLGLIIWRSQGVDLDNKGEITQFYQFIWKLFFLEYFLFPTACLFS